MSSIHLASPLEGKRVGFIGKLGGLNRREAQQLVHRQGGALADSDFIESADVDLVIIGADSWPPANAQQLLGPAIESAVAAGRVEVISETELWQRLGLVDDEQHIRRLYTPAMLAELLDVSIAVIRRWHRRKLIVPARKVHRLPYFDFQEVATARRLAELLAAGATPAEIERRLDELARFVPGVERPMAQLSVMVEGRQILLRQGAGLVEPGGQLRIDFDTLDQSCPPSLELQVDEPAEEEQQPPDDDFPATLSFDLLSQVHRALTPDDMLAEATSFEDQGRLPEAIEAYRSLLVAVGPHAETCFQLAELLFRVGDHGAARERYYMAIELDEDFVEARANLGCLLVETGDLELAVAAFQGALRHHPDFPDAHYHLARLLKKCDRHEEALQHWRSFLVLAPESPWADEAIDQVSRQWRDQPVGTE